MGHVRKGTLTAPPEWWKHLRPFLKRKTARAERQAGKALTEDEANEPDDSPKGLGLHKDPAKMKWMREHEGETVIPSGIYCYLEDGDWTDKDNCPYWDRAENREKQGNGFCWFLGKGDWDEGIGELWDQCKCCGVKEDIAPEGTILVVDHEEVE